MGVTASSWTDIVIVDHDCVEDDDSADLGCLEYLWLVPTVYC